MDSQPPLLHAELGTKLGYFVTGTGQVPYSHPHTWRREPAGNGERIVAGPSGGFIDLTLQLVGCLEPPYSVMYVLAVPRRSEPGRYQLDRTLELDELRLMLEPYRAFFEGDARHHLWIYSHPSASTVVYDLHNLIYAYGPLNRYIEVLEQAGLREGDVELPFPHYHNYFEEFDADEERIIRSHSWKRTGLLPGVDD